MAKLYPPQIEGTIPAFYGNIITVPYLMNKTVSLNEIDGFKLQFKSIMTNQVLGVFNSQSGYNNSSVSFDVSFIERTIQKENGDIATEKISTDNWLKIGQSYKVQLAYVKKDTKEIGYYSTVGIVKYTNKPQLNIEGFDESGTNLPKSFEFIGTYNNSDLSEKAYSYCFNIYKSNGELYETSGELLHNYEAEDAGDKWIRKKELIEGESYSIQYLVTTINKIQAKSPKYRLGASVSINPDFEIEIKAKLNKEDGYILISLEQKKEEHIRGSFVISRASSLDNFSEWTEINRFAILSDLPSQYSYKDFTIWQGVTYKYTIQQYNFYNQIYSNKIYSNEILSDFEHIYLFNGERQLKIKFNPKISSFKSVLQESKVDTMGGKFPFFFRNEALEYKEFPISGLISYLSDENQFFLKNEEIQLIDEKEKTTNIEGYNITSERLFREKVLEFLTDGKPKLFKSPTEGNFIVRLMNTSLTPNDTLGRMLYTFNSTAYEIDFYNSEALNKYHFIKINEPDSRQMKFKTILAKDLKPIGNESFISIGEENNIYSIQCEDFAPGTILQIYHSDNKYAEIQISFTGMYEANFDFPLQKIRIRKGLNQGQITYSYLDDKINTLDLYKEIKSADKPLIQFIGDTCGDIKNYIGYTIKDSSGRIVKIFNERLPLQDLKHQVISYVLIHATKREMLEIQKQDQKFYLNGEHLKNLEPIYIYHFQEEIEKNGEIIKQDYYIDGNIGFEKIFDTCEYYIQINEEKIDLEHTYEFLLSNLEYVPKVTGSLGTIIEVSVIRREIIYDLEESDKEIRELKNKIKNEHKVGEIIDSQTNKLYVSNFKYGDKFYISNIDTTTSEYNESMYTKRYEFLNKNLMSRTVFDRWAQTSGDRRTDWYTNNTAKYFIYENEPIATTSQSIMNFYDKIKLDTEYKIGIEENGSFNVPHYLEFYFANQSLLNFIRDQGIKLTFSGKMTINIEAFELNEDVNFKVFPTIGCFYKNEQQNTVSGGEASKDYKFTVPTGNSNISQKIDFEIEYYIPKYLSNYNLSYIFVRPFRINKQAYSSDFFDKTRISISFQELSLVLNRIENLKYEPIGKIYTLNSLGLTEPEKDDKYYTIELGKTISFKNNGENDEDANDDYDNGDYILFLNQPKEQGNIKFQINEDNIKQFEKESIQNYNIFLNKLEQKLQLKYSNIFNDGGVNDV